MGLNVLTQGKHKSRQEKIKPKDIKFRLMLIKYENKIYHKSFTNQVPTQIYRNYCVRKV